jgi:hypothetical protein
MRGSIYATDYLTNNARELVRFKERFIEDAETLNFLLDVEWQLCSFYIQCTNVNPVIMVAIQNVHRYHIKALIFGIENEPTLALAILRIACELSRDILRMMDNQSLISIWLDKTSSGEQKRRQSFRFNTSDDFEKMLKDAYDLACSWGVHCHITIPGDATQTFQHNEKGYTAFDSDESISKKNIKVIAQVIEAHTYLCLLKLRQKITSQQDRGLATEFAQFGMEFSEIMGLSAKLFP